MDWSRFLEDKRGLMIAPAGHGKTHAIAECVKQCVEGRQLILTHTHAGIASIRLKLKKMNVSSASYHIETISGFAQSIVLSFIGNSKLPKKEDKTYFDEVIKGACKLVKTESFKTVLIISYNHMFLDEYQDCNVDQNELLMLMAEVLPTHIFGDEMQGIFTFNGTLVNFGRDLVNFNTYNQLQTPWRWKNRGNNAVLGDWILSIRSQLEQPQATITLRSDKTANVKVIKKNFDWSSYYKSVSNVLSNIKSNSILVIFPSFKENGIPHGGLNDRTKIKPLIDYSHQFMLIEAIDEKSYYSTAKLIDELISCIKRARNKYSKIYDVLEKMSLKKETLHIWFSPQKVLVKKRGDKAILSQVLSQLCSSFIEAPSYESLKHIIDFFYVNCKGQYHRSDLFRSIRHCLGSVVSEGDSLYEQMSRFKDNLRRGGRKIEGKCIGTTLLTKGLEFDTVVILHADKFEDARNFYVAISRACKELIIFTGKEKLNF